MLTLNPLLSGVFAHFTTHQEPTLSIEACLDILATLLSVEDRKAVATFIRRCLKLQPKQRATAKELLDDPWLNADIGISQG